MKWPCFFIAVDGGRCKRNFQKTIFEHQNFIVNSKKNYLYLKARERNLFLDAAIVSIANL